jgi:hypothetical protein
VRFGSLSVAGFAVALAVGASAAGESVLFIGNSFTYGAGSAVRHYRSDTVADLNNEGVGGVPALFKAFTQQAGLEYDVALETIGGAGLDVHLAKKLNVIAARGWDTVVAHGYSTLDPDKPRDPARLIATSKQLADVLRRKNPNVNLYLTATWSRADQVYPNNGAWAGSPIDAMAKDIRTAYDRAAAGAGAKVIPVGDAWNRAMQTGIADTNPYDGIDAGKLDLWTHDHYHASTYGYYLEALVIFGRVTGRDPRSLGGSECSAYELHLSAADASRLQQIAFDELKALGPAEPQPFALPSSPKRERCTAR